MKYFYQLLFIFLLEISVAQAQTISSAKFTVLFPKNSIELSKSLEDSIVNMFRDLNAGKIYYVDINSYCSEEDNRIFNNALATRRAKNIADFIRSNNIAPNNVINYNGYAEYLAKETLTEISVSYLEDALPPPNTSGLDKQTLLSGKTIRLKINFYPGEATLTASSYPYLAQLKQFLVENPELRIEIQGHVCCNNNLDLSYERAEEVFIKLQEMGINKTRMEYKGFGNTQLLVSDVTDEDREINRRVEIKLLQ